MKKYFITYGDSPIYEVLKERLACEAKALYAFDVVRTYGRADVTQEVLGCPAMQVRRGGGLWAWKPDVILSTLYEMSDGDMLVYCDSACAVQHSKEWARLFEDLSEHDMVVQRLCHFERRWTRREILEAYPDVQALAEKGCCQLMATVLLLRKTPFTMKFIERYDWVRDVEPEERAAQNPAFVSNRHDQSIMSVLAYHCLLNHEGRIKLMWDRVEGWDPFRSQAIRTHCCSGTQRMSFRRECRSAFVRFVRHWLLIPFVFTRQLGNRLVCYEACSLK